MMHLDKLKELYNQYSTLYALRFYGERKQELTVTGFRDGLVEVLENRDNYRRLIQVETIKEVIVHDKTN